jgi:hypothetical protein
MTPPIDTMVSNRRDSSSSMRKRRFGSFLRNRDLFVPNNPSSHRQAMF